MRVCWSLGYVAFFAIGAYVTAILTHLSWAFSIFPSGRRFLSLFDGNHRGSTPRHSGSQDARLIIWLSPLWDSEKSFESLSFGLLETMAGRGTGDRPESLRLYRRI